MAKKSKVPVKKTVAKKQHTGHPYNPNCKCARCKRITAKATNTSPRETETDLTFYKKQAGVNEEPKIEEPKIEEPKTETPEIPLSEIIPGEVLENVSKGLHDESVLKYLQDNPDFYLRVGKEEIDKGLVSVKENLMGTVLTELFKHRHDLPDDVILFRMPDGLVEKIQEKVSELKSKFTFADYGDFLDKLATNGIELYLKSL